MENNAIQPLNNTMALSKSSQTDFANNLIKSVTKGEVDPIAAFCQIRGLSDSLSLFLKNEEVKEAVDKAKEKMGGQLRLSSMALNLLSPSLASSMISQSAMTASGMISTSRRKRSKPC